MSAAWPTASMGEIAPLVRRPILPEANGQYHEIGIRSFGKGVFHKAPTTGLEIGNKRVFAVEPGDLLFNIVFAWEGATAVATEAERGMIGSHRFLTCVTDKTRADAKFLNYWFTHSLGREQLLRASPGGAGRNRTLGIEKLSEVHVPLPPLDEQRRIVARIEELAAKVEEARELRSIAEREVEAFVSGSIDDYFRLAPGWKASTIHELCEHPQYGFTAPSTRDQVGPKLLRITDIQDGQVDWDGVPYCYCQNPDSYLLRDGDLVFARTGGTTGKSFIIRQCPPAVYASYLIRLRPKNSVLVEYLHWFFQSRGYWQQIADGIRGTGQPNLNGSKLAGLSIPLAPMDEQRRIVAELDTLQMKVDSVKALQSETAAELAAILPAILDKAFKGELV